MPTWGALQYELPDDWSLQSASAKFDYGAWAFTATTFTNQNADQSML